MIVRELLTRLGFAVDESRLRQYERGTNNIRVQADAAAESFRNVFLAFAGFSALKSIAHTADEMQSLEARIGQLPQTVGTAGDAFDRVAQKASDARQGIEGYAGFYIKAGNATQDFIKDQEQLLKVVDGAAIALAASGSDATRQKEAFFQLGQAIGSPVVQMEEMNTVIDVAPDLFRALGKAIPGANGNLKKFVSTGTVTGKMLAEGLIKILPQFVDQMQQIPMTIGTATVLIGNRWAVFINRLNRESSAVTKVAGLFLSAFDKIEIGLANMVQFFGNSTNTIKFFGIALAAALAPALFKLAAGAIAFLLSPLGLLLGTLVLAGLAIEDFYQWMNGGKSIFQQWFGSFDQARTKLAEYSGWITAAKISVVSAVGVMALNWIWAAGVAVVAAATTAGAWLAALGRFSAALLFNTLLVSGWAANLLIVMGGVVVGWISSFVSMAIAAAPVLLPILAITAGVAAIIAAVFLLLDNWKLIFKTIKDIATGNWSEIANDFGAMVDRLKSYWNSFKSFFGVGVSTTIGASAMPAAPAAPAISPATVAGAASPSGGIVAPSTGNSVVIKIDQTLPPGTTAETAQAARDAVNQAWNSLPVDRLARQMGQVGG